MRTTALILLLTIFGGAACSSSRSVAPNTDSAKGAGPRRPQPVHVEISLDRDSYGFNDMVMIDVLNIVDHDVAVLGLCNLQVLGRADDQWHAVWFVDCSRDRLATTWIAPGEVIQYGLNTREWSEAAHPEYKSFVVRHMGASSDPFRLDSKRR